MSVFGSKEDNYLNEYGESSREGWSIGGIFLLLLLLALVIFFVRGGNITRTFYPDKKELDIVIQPPANGWINAQKQEKKEVFHVSNNTHSYRDAQAVCQAYDAELATYQQVEDAYRAGGDWCSYGWSQDQLALYPTQVSTYDKLQKIKGHEHDCGRPGINGGYIANPDAKFGVNCWGKKPAITGEETNLMKLSPIPPKNPEDIAKEQRVQFWKSHLAQILLSPFNTTEWSRY